MVSELSSLGDLMQTDASVRPRNISNSEVVAFLSCKRMYDFAFMDSLAPKETPNPLARGSIGHLAFELYGRERIDGKNHETAYRLSLEAFAKPDPSYKIDAVMHAQLLYQRYMDFHKGWPEWRILGVEERHTLPLSPTINMPITYDFYVEEIATGRHLIGDYKFTYDFWSLEDHDTNCQMPKYISVMQANGLRVDGGILEEIRTRNLGKEKASDPKNLWRRTRYQPSIARSKTMLRQHVAASLAIEKHRQLSKEERLTESIPLFSKHGACKFCNFKDLCNSMTEGKKDLSVDIRTGYTRNEYAEGYNPSAAQQEAMDKIL